MPLNGDYQPSTSDWARKQAEQYEETGGTSGTTLHGKPVVVLTSVGSKTGALRKTPLMRVEHNGEYAVIASLGGAPKNPAWYHNLITNPRVELRDGAEKGEYIACEVSGEERELWWRRAAEAWPAYDDYQAKTSRVIPVFVLTPVIA